MNDKIWIEILDHYDYPERPCDTECKEPCCGRDDCPLLRAWIRRRAKELETLERTLQKIKPDKHRIIALPLLQEEIRKQDEEDRQKGMQAGFVANYGADKVERIKKQFSADVCQSFTFGRPVDGEIPEPICVCQNHPPEISHCETQKACLSCVLRETCKILFVEK